MDAIVASSSTLYGEAYLEYLIPSLLTHFKGIDELLFIPLARPSGLETML